MPTIYNIEELRLIHKEHRADNGVIYQTEDRYFQGDEKGRLNDVTDITINNITNTNITNNETDITALETEVARLETSKADKCFTIAMSIIL